jgi:hypothetical protein
MGVPVAGLTILKLREPEARILALRIAVTFPNFQAETAQIKEAVPKYRQLGPADLLPSKTRKNECMWQQIVGNVVSHDRTSVSIFRQGYADRLASIKSIRVTPKGIDYLKKLGWL